MMNMFESPRDTRFVVRYRFPRHVKICIFGRQLPKMHQKCIFGRQRPTMHAFLAGSGQKCIFGRQRPKIHFWSAVAAKVCWHVMTMETSDVEDLLGANDCMSTQRLIQACGNTLSEAYPQTKKGCRRGTPLDRLLHGPKVILPRSFSKLTLS